MLYKILKLIIGFGMRLYYREIRVVNKEVLNDHNGPMIIIANHPNTMMDAWLLGKLKKSQIYYMAKGTFFNTALKKRLLMSLGMIPVNRKTDGETAGVSNSDSFEACYRILEQGKTLVIFPEGNSFQERGLRDLKTGTARISLEAQFRNDGKLNLLIVPVGLYYTMAHRFQSSVLVNVGEPIRLDLYVKQYRESSTQAVRDLTDTFRKKLQSLLVLISDPNREELLERLLGILHDGDKDGVFEHAQRLSSLDELLANIQLTDPARMEKIQKLVSAYFFEKEQVSLRDDYLGKGGKKARFIRETLLSVFFLIIGLPFFIFGTLHNIVPFQLTALITNWLTKNIEYYAPVAILLGFGLYPLNYGLIIWFTVEFLELSFIAALIYFISMPLLGLYAYYYLHLSQAFFKRVRFLSKRLDHVVTLKSLKAIRKELLQMTDHN